MAPTAIGWTRHFTGGSGKGVLALAFNALSSLFLWTAVAVILRDLFRTPEAGAGKMRGAICGCLIAADAWTGINSCALRLAPHSFVFVPKPLPVKAPDRMRTQRVAVCSQFDLRSAP